MHLRYPCVRGGAALRVCFGLALAFGSVLALPMAAAAEPEETSAIEVHGHWTIDVLDPDGALVTHNDFENGLDVDGNKFLATVLSRQGSVAAWLIVLGSTSQSPCLGGRGCRIVEESIEASGQPGASRNLVVSVPASGANAGTLVLSGSFVAGQDGDIINVNTLPSTCEPTTAPGATLSSCFSTQAYAFTARTLATAIAVAEGQQVQVTVVISFS